jgi:Domain of unknown function (DUF4123)/FHA domain
MRVVLNVCTGPAAGKKVVLHPEEAVTVGRGRGASLAVPQDSLLSNAHFRVICNQKGCTIEDLDSRNGTVLNGTRILRAALADGDRISAGEALVEVTIEVPASGLADEPLSEALRKQAPLFAILDAARDRSILPLLEDDIDGDVQCLYDGQSAADLADYAPYLASLPVGSALLDALILRGWGSSWAVYLTSREPIDTVRHHLRQFLIVQRADGKEAYFRFYDPRVLRIYLESLAGLDVGTFFGPIDAYLMESERPEYLLRFSPARHECPREVLPVRRA